MTTQARNQGRQPRRRGGDASEQQPAVANGAAAPAYPPRVLTKLRDEIGPQLMGEFGYTSPMQVPRFSKIVLNIGMGEALQNARAMENATRDLTLISGQRPVTTRAKRSVAGFKIREGMPIGLSVTLRGRRMYEFYDRLVSSALPRIRDFQGVSREAFDGRGNFSLGIREQVIFPEIDYNSIDRIRGLQVVVVTTARTDREGLRLLELLGMPFTRGRDAVRVA
jgi:large subunit ribosomal protein L5